MTRIFSKISVYINVFDLNVFDPKLSFKEKRTQHMLNKTIIKYFT